MSSAAGRLEGEDWELPIGFSNTEANGNFDKIGLSQTDGHSVPAFSSYRLAVFHGCCFFRY